MSIHLKTVSYKATLLSMALGLFGFTIALAASGDPGHLSGELQISHPLQRYPRLSCEAGFVCP